MTKAELQSALAAAAQTDKKTVGVFLDTLSDIAYKATKKERRIRRAWIWEARKTEEEGTHRD
jgi:nucleoid DNA-binding protein